MKIIFIILFRSHNLVSNHLITFFTHYSLHLVKLVSYTKKETILFFHKQNNL